MSITLETLILEYQADFSQLNRQLTQGVAKAKVSVKELENITIKPNIDLSGLLDAKKMLLDMSSNSGKSSGKTSSKGSTSSKTATSFTVTVPQLDLVTKEIIEVRKAIRKESSVRFGNVLRGTLQKGVISTAGKVGADVFGIKGNPFEKVLQTVLPSVQIIGRDIDALRTKFANITGVSGLMQKNLDNLALELTDASQATSTMGELFGNLKDAAKRSFDSFKTDIKTVGENAKELDLKAELGLGSATDIAATLGKSATVRSAARGVVGLTEKRVVARKERIEEERRPEVLKRAKELVEQDVKTVKEDPKKIATRYKNAMAAVTKETEELLIVIGGHTATMNNGIFIAEDLNKAFKDLGVLAKKRAVGLKNPDTFIGESQNPAMPLLSMARPNVRGFSRDTEEAMAQAIAAMTKNPNLKVNIVGESGAGLRAEDAIIGLNRMGFGDRVSGVGVGTPSLKGKVARPENFTAFLSANQEEIVGTATRDILAPFGLVDPQATKTNPQVSQSVKGVKQHVFDEYLELTDVQAKVFGEDLSKQLGGKEQTRATDTSIKNLQNKVIDKIRVGMIFSAKKDIKAFEDITRIEGGQKPGFEQLKQDVAKLDKDKKLGSFPAMREAEDYLQTFAPAIPKAIEAGDVGLLEGMEQKLPKLGLDLQILQAEGSKLTGLAVQGILDDIKKVQEQLPAAKAQAQAKKDTGSSVTKDALKGSIKVFKDRLIVVRKELQKKIAEGVVTKEDIVAAERLLMQGTGLTEALKSEGGFAKEATALGGVTATLGKQVKATGDIEGLAEDASEDVVSGILQGTNEALAQVLNQGEELGTTLLQGFEKALGIQSPARLFIASMKMVGKGITKGAAKVAAPIKKDGEIIAQALFGGFKQEAQRTLPQVLADARILSQKTTKFTTGRKADREDTTKRIAFNKSKIQDLHRQRAVLQKKGETATKAEFALLVKQDAKLKSALATANKHLVTLKAKSSKYLEQEKSVDKLAKLNQALQKATAKQDVTKIAKITTEIQELNEEISGEKQQPRNLLQEFGLDDVESGIKSMSGLMERMVGSGVGGSLLSGVKKVAPKLGKEVANGIGRFLTEIGKTQSIKDLPKSVIAGLGSATGLRNVGEIGTTQRGRMIAAGATAIGLLVLSKRLTKIISDAITLQKQLDIIDKKLEAINQAPSTNIFDEFGKEAARARMRVIDFADAYAGMVVALKNKVVDPRALFSDLTKGLADRGVIGEGAKNAILALQQMASKGVVSMEELRRQLGNALPGAVTLMANALGVSDSRLIAMVSSGQLLATEALPALAKELQVTSGSTSTFTEELTSLQNTWDQARFNANKVLPLKEGVIALHAATKVLNTIIKPLTVVGIPIFITLVGNLLFQLGALALKTNVVTAALGFMKSVVPPLALAMVGIGAAMSLYDSILVKSADNTRRLGKELENLGKTGREVESVYKTSNLFARIGEFGLKGLRRTGLPVVPETASEREERVNRQEIVEQLPKLLELSLDYQLTTNEEDIQEAANSMAEDLERIQELAYKAARRETYELSIPETRAIQKEVEELQKQIDFELETKFNVTEMEQSIKIIESLRNNAQSEIDKGANEQLYRPIIQELESAENRIRKALDAVKSTKLDIRPVLQLDIDSKVAQQSLQQRITQITTQIQTEGLQQALDENLAQKTLATINLQSTVKAKQKELELTKAVNVEQRKFVALLNKVQRDKLLDMTGATEVSAIDFAGIERAKALIEEEKKANIAPDPVLESAIQKLEILATNTQKVNDINRELTQNQLDLRNSTRELNTEIATLNVTRLQRVLDARDLELQLFRTFDNSEVLFTNRMRARKEARQSARTLKQQERAYQDLVISIEQASIQLTNSIKTVAIRIEQAGKQLITQSLQGISTFMSAAGIEDLFGLGQFRQLTTKGIGISKSDRTAQLEQQLETERQNASKREFDLLRQQSRLNADLDNAIADLQDSVLEASRQRQTLLQDTEMNMDRLLLRIQETQNTTNQLNRDINAANQQAQLLGVDKRLPGLDVTLPDISNFEQAPEAVLGQLDLVLQELEGAKQETIDFYRSIQAEGNAEIGRALDSNRQLFTEKIGLMRQEIEQEQQRVKQANENLVKEISGSILKIQDNLVTKINELNKKALDAREGVSALFKQAGFGVDRDTMLGGVMAKITNDVDNRIAEFERAQQSLERLLEAYEGEAGADFIRNLLDSDEAISALDSSVRNSLMQELQKATDSENYQELGNTIQSLITTYQTLTGELKGNKEAITEGVTAIAARKGTRKLQDAELELAKQMAEGVKFEMESTKAFMKIDIDEKAARQSLERELEGMVGEFDTETIEAYRDLMLEINEIKFDKARKEASELNKIMTSSMDALEGGLSDAIAGIGNIFFDRADRENEILKQKADYGEKIAALYEEHRDNPDLLDTELERLGRKNEEILDSMGREFGVFNQVIDLGRQALAGFAKALAEAAAKMAASAIISGIGKTIFGFANGGTVPNFAGGGMAPMMVQNAANGAKVAALTAGIQQAMVREGNNAVPIVAQKGEQILSTKNGDAQFWRALRDNNMWDALKSGNVANFAGGGTVGGNMMNLVPVTNNNTGGNSTYNLIQNNTYNLPQTTGFNKSMSQIESARQAQMKRELERNG